MAVPWNPVTAAYLLRRTGFGATAAAVAEFAQLGQAAAVARLVDYESIDNSACEAHLQAYRTRFSAQNPNPMNFQRVYLNVNLWSLRMLTTARPLEEKMTLFWHGHFATSYDKVNQGDSMFLQIDMLRRNAMTDFRQMLVDVSADPAMLIWLDNYVSTKEDPNENYGRELMELFSLGIGHYTEDDINEIARSFTGWTLRVDRQSGVVTTLYLEGIHDTGSKTFLGQTVPAGLSVQADGAKVCEIIADTAQCPRFLATKLWAYFAGGAIPDRVMSAMTAAYASNSHSIREMVRTMLLADEFYQVGVADEQIKSPTDLVVGTMRTLETNPALFYSQNRDIFRALYNLFVYEGVTMGQLLFLPPSVKGWDGARKWINTSTLLDRYNFGTLIATDVGLPFVDATALVARSGQTTAEGLVDYFLTLLGPLDIGTVARRRLIDYMNANPDGSKGTFTLTAESTDTKVRGLLKLILSTAEYQVNSKGLDPGVVAPILASPTLKKGKLLIAANGSNIQQGAELRVTGESIEGTETFALSKNSKGTKWVVKKNTLSTPGGTTVDALVPTGTPVTFVVENPDGGQSQPADFTR